MRILNVQSNLRNIFPHTITKNNIAVIVDKFCKAEPKFRWKFTPFAFSVIDFSSKCFM